MTALETLVYNSLDLATLGTELYSTTTCLDSLDDETRSTSIACSITTALNNIQVPDNVMLVRDAQSYVESMTTEELITLEQMLEQKELTFSEENVKEHNQDIVKVYTKQGPKQQ